MILASFNYNNKEYVYHINNNKIEYGYKDKNGIVKELNPEEINLLNYIYTKLVISPDKKNHKKCGIVNYNNKKFQIMYDKVSDIKFFYEIYNNTYKLPTYDDFIYLDSKLNPEYLYDEIDYSDVALPEMPNYNYKDKIKKKIINGISITLYMNFLFTLYTQLYNFTNLYIKENKEKSYIEQLEQSYNQYIDMDITIDDLQQVVINNTNLSFEEKEFVISNFDIIENNIEYINMPMIYDRLQDLEITYYKDPCPANDPYITIGAAYSNLNEINLYSCSSFSEIITNDHYAHNMRHELFHVFTSKFRTLGNKIYESMNEIYNVEYNNEDLTQGSYFLERQMVYLLIELLGPNVLKEFYFNHDPQILIDNLIEIIPEEEKAYELIGMIDNLSIEYIDQLNKGVNNETALSRTYTPINNLINEYFMVKYGYDMMEDEIIQNYVYMQTNKVSNLMCVKEFIASQNPENYSCITNYVLAYFSEEYINVKYPDGIPKQTFMFMYTTSDDKNMCWESYNVNATTRQNIKSK